MKYKVFVDDNFHYGAEDERYLIGEYGSCQEAVDICKRASCIELCLEKAEKQ